MADMLGGLGIRVAESDGAEEGLKQCRSRSLDVVVMAPEGQHIAAPDFLRRLRRSCRGGRAPVVIFYAVAQDAAAIGETILEGAADFIMQPLDQDLLRFKLHQAGVVRAA